MPRPFALDVRPDRDRVHVAPAGELDLVTVGEVDRCVADLTAAGFAHVVVDLREVEFIDSTGLRLMLRLRAHSRDEGWTLSLVQGPPSVRRIFELTGTLDTLPFENG